MTKVTGLAACHALHLMLIWSFEPSIDAKRSLTIVVHSRTCQPLIDVLNLTVDAQSVGTSACSSQTGQSKIPAAAEADCKISSLLARLQNTQHHPGN